MNKIIALTDYKGFFGSKKGASPYRSGFNKDALKTEFKKKEAELVFWPLASAANGDFPFPKASYVIYTSSEDPGAPYKSFIEDVVLSLDLSGYNVIPRFQFLRAHENKVFMEMLRANFSFGLPSIGKPKTMVYGTIEDFYSDEHAIGKFPIVIKSSRGSMSRGVDIASDPEELKRKLSRMSSSSIDAERLKDFVRPWIHSGYIKNSANREKFVLQEFIPELQSDWKILIYGEKYYIFQRPVRKADFRASGSGHKNYIYGADVDPPSGIFDFAKSVYEVFDSPNLSLDIAFSEGSFYLIEFQSIYFGTVGQERSSGYFREFEKGWDFIEKDYSVERVYAESIVNYVSKREG